MGRECNRCGEEHYDSIDDMRCDDGAVAASRISQLETELAAEKEARQRAEEAIAHLDEGTVGHLLCKLADERAEHANTKAELERAKQGFRYCSCGCHSPASESALKHERALADALVAAGKRVLIYTEDAHDACGPSCGTHELRAAIADLERARAEKEKP